MNILIADDDLTMRLILSGLVKAWGYEPVLVEDGSAALTALRQDDAPMLGLIDWEMPGLDGPDVCRELRSDQRARPLYLILLTAREGKDHVVKGLEAGADDYVTKPFNNAELHARIQVGSRLIELQRDLESANSLLSEERRVVENILLSMRESAELDNRNLRDLQVPVERTSGDVLFSAFTPDGTQHVFLGDFTGHGLSAAIGGPMVSDVFYAMTRKGFSASDILGEMNSHLAEKLPVGLFLAAIMVSVSPDRRSAVVINCGMQDVLQFRSNAELQRIPPQNLALAILDKGEFTEQGFAVEPGDRIYAYSDGLVEVTDSQGRMFGIDGVSGAIAHMLRQQADMASLRSALMTFGELERMPDDVTVAEITC